MLKQAKAQLRIYSSLSLSLSLSLLLSWHFLCRPLSLTHAHVKLTWSTFHRPWEKKSSRPLLSPYLGLLPRCAFHLVGTHCKDMPSGIHLFLQMILYLFLLSCKWFCFFVVISCF